MTINEKYDLEGLYHQGLQHFNRGEWAAAISLFTELRSVTDQYPQIDELVADARLKQQLMGTDQPIPLAPPKRSVFTPILVVLALCMLGGGGFIVAQALNKPAPPVAAMVVPTSVPPTVLPTAPPTVIPIVAPTAVVPTSLPDLPTSFVVGPAAGEAFANAPQNIQMVVDASGSMLAKVGDSGKQRWQVAQEALRAMLDSGAIPLQSNVGIRTYGRQRGNDCRDMEVAEPLAPFSYERALNVVDTIKPAVQGMTPLAASIHAASEELKRVQGSSVIILVTDGIESCNGDPIAEAASFIAGGENRKINVIGFAIDDPTASDNLRAIATNGNGLYLDAENTDDLADALLQAVVLHYQLTTPSGNEVAHGLVGGNPVDIKAGAYHLKVDSMPPFEQDVVVKSNQRVQVELSQGFGSVSAEVKVSPR